MICTLRRSGCNWSRLRYLHRKFHAERPALAVNKFGVDLLPAGLNARLFRGVRASEPGQDVVKAALAELEKFGLSSRGDGETVNLPDVSPVLPDLQGRNVLEHFYNICSVQNQPYLDALSSFLKAEAPPPPRSWQIQPGWIRYGFDGSCRRAEHPEGDNFPLVRCYHLLCDIN